MTSFYIGECNNIVVVVVVVFALNHPSIDRLIAPMMIIFKFCEKHRCA